MKSDNTVSDFRQIILELAARVFSQRDNDDFTKWSSVFMLQEGHNREQQIRELLGENRSGENGTLKTIFADIDKEIEFRTYDFLTSNDGDDEGLLRDVFYEDIAMFMNDTAAESGRDPLEVNVDHLKRLLSTVLTIPRNDQEDKVSWSSSNRH